MTAKYAIGVDPASGRLLWSQLHGGKRGTGNMTACTMVFRNGGLYGCVGHGIGGLRLQLRRSEKTGRVEAVKQWSDKNLDNLQGGIYRWYVQNNRAYMTMRDWNTKPFETIANCLNFRRALRAQVEPKLDELRTQVAALKQQLDRIEGKLSA